MYSCLLFPVVCRSAAMMIITIVIVSMIMIKIMIMIMMIMILVIMIMVIVKWLRFLFLRKHKCLGQLNMPERAHFTL